MQRSLLIPYATNEVTGEVVSAKELAVRMLDWRDTIRLDATLDRNTATRKVARYLCPSCGKLVYPRAPVRANGRHFWSHRPKSSENCPLSFGRPLSRDQINRLIFSGRQEGEAHRNLVALLSALALADPNTVKDTFKTGEYEKPTLEMAIEFPHGRFPDVAFTYGRDRVVLEAQLATIALHGINGRRAYYDRHESVLLWVTRNFDPTGLLRASLRDILADQRGLLLSIDSEAQELSAAGGMFYLRSWTYDFKDGEATWTSQILPLAEVIKIARPRLWSDDFKERFIEAYEGKNYLYEGVNPLQFLNEAMRELKLPEYDELKQGPSNLLAMLRLMISLEAGRPIGIRYPKLISMANNFDSNGCHRYRAIILKAVEHWQPELLQRTSMQSALERAAQKLRETKEAPFGRNSIIGRLRDILFPRWDLGAAGRRDELGIHPSV